MKMMKKIVALLLLAGLILGLCACGSDTDAVERALQGTWKEKNGVYKFSDGEFTCEAIVAGISLGEKAGTYTIKGNTIILNYDNGVEAKLKYTFEEGDLVFENGMVKKTNASSANMPAAEAPAN